MKRTVLTFGLASGAVMSALMLTTIPLQSRIGFDHGVIVGYTTMVIALLLVFFGVRSYRDNVAGGRLTFGRGLVVGSLIALVTCVCYVITWLFMYYALMPDFVQHYQAHIIAKLEASGASAEVIARQKREMQEFAALYANPLFNAAITFLEPLPVALVASIFSAGVLRRRVPDGPVGPPAAS